jgi:hypothetical protein
MSRRGTAHGKDAMMLHSFQKWVLLDFKVPIVLGYEPSVRTSLAPSFRATLSTLHVSMKRVFLVQPVQNKQ